DWPEFRADNDAFWSVASQMLLDIGVDAPSNLSRDYLAEDVWRNPDLLIGQSCGRPLMMGACGNAVPFGRPVHDVAGCGAGTYRSALIVRHDGPETLAGCRNSRAVINGENSHSGYAAFKAALSGFATPGQRHFEDVIVSGAHRSSLDHVATGRADICSVDAVAWAMYQQVEPGRAALLKVIGWSPEAPALPYITASRFADISGFFANVLDTAAQASPRSPAVPIGVIPASQSDYEVMRELEGAIAEVAL
ncbi:MAG: PhnD/SsuA/transferrin family substrate-binding protein, partial [Pseudomonadota bacterium]